MKTYLLVLGLIFWSLGGCASPQLNSQEKAKTNLTCEVSGCNHEICGEKGKGMISTCVILPQHECLRKTKCEVQENGKCGWTPNEEYQACMKRFSPK